MRAGIVVCLTLVATSAAAEPRPKLEPKRPTTKYSAQALEFFFQGLAYQIQGELHFAFNAYSSSRHDKNHEPETFFNQALLYLELEQTSDAARLFKYYLEHSPKDVADRAQIEKLRQELETADPVVTIGGEVRDTDEEADALILVDGRLIGASPVTLTPTEGNHEAERITATTYKRASFRARRGTREYVELSATTKDHGGGNVVITGLTEGTWKEGTTKFAMGKRFALPPGRYKTTPFRVSATTCTPIEFEVKSVKELTYVRVIGDEAPGARCLTVKQVAVQRLKVGGK